MDEEEEISPTQEIDFCTMGMFIIGKTEVAFLFLRILKAFIILPPTRSWSLALFTS
jgi:hypothetical protein